MVPGNSVHYKCSVQQKKRNECLLEKIRSLLNEKIQQQSSSDWSSSDKLMLMERLENALPNQDPVYYKERLRFINWESIAWGSHTAEDCRHNWMLLQRSLRKVRTLHDLITDAKSTIEIPVKNRRKSSETSARQRERRTTPFFVFLTDKRGRIIRENPDLNYQEVLKKCGDIFRNLPMKKRRRYQHLTNVLREEYKSKPQPKTKQLKTIELEKPLTPYELFAREDVANANLSSNEALIKWRKLDDDDRLFWINWANEQYRYYVKTLKYNRRIDPGFKSNRQSILSLKERRLLANYGRPRQPPKSAYHLFCKETMNSMEIDSVPCRDRMSYASSKWSQLSVEEKCSYEERVKDLKTAYRRAIKQT